MTVTDDLLCFSLYSAARATTQAYRRLLEPWKLTYPQYLVLALLWAEDDQSIRSLGDAMKLDSGTLSPLVRRLEHAGLVTRSRDVSDERVTRISLTEAGSALRSEVAPVHRRIAEIAGIENGRHRELIRELQDITARLQDEDASRPLTSGTQN